jgi:hypothetical protein
VASERTYLLRRLIFVALAFFLALITFFVGKGVGQRAMFTSMRTDLHSVQTMLAFNRILDERRLRSLISRGCINQAVDELDFLKDRDMELLSQYLKGTVDKSTVKYISDRDSHLIDELRDFKSKYGSVRSEGVCKSP